jgi:hypothetical protein
VVPLFVTTHEHFGIQLNLFDLFDSRITVVHAVTGPRCRLEAGVTKCNTGRAVELEAVRGPRAGGGGATFEQQQALDPLLDPDVIGCLDYLVPDSLTHPIRRAEQNQHFGASVLLFYLRPGAQ